MAKKRISPLDTITTRQWASMTNTAIGDRVGGMSGQAVGRYRKRHGHPRPDKRQTTAKSWGAAGQHRRSPLAELDNTTWSTSTNVELADLMGISMQSIADYRHRHSKPASPGRWGQTQRWTEKPVESALTPPERAVADAWYRAYKGNGGEANRATFLKRAAEMEGFLVESYIDGIGSRRVAWQTWLNALEGHAPTARPDLWARREATRIFNAVDSVTAFS